MVSNSVFDRSAPPQGMSAPGNPNPYRFRVERTLLVGGHHTVAEVTYPDASSYEGRKILLYLNTWPEVVRDAKSLDPHFSKPDGVHLVPFARFEPTEAGWNAAVKMAELM